MRLAQTAVVLLCCWFPLTQLKIASADEAGRRIKVAVVQFDAKPEALDQNLQTVERLARSAVAKGARWVLFHEGCLHDYTGRVDEFAEEVPQGASTKRIIHLASELNCFIAFGITERDGEARYLTQVFVGPEGYIHRYRKTWLYKDVADKGFRDEFSRFDPGTGPELFVLDGVRVTCFICADGASKRCVARAASLKPQVVFYPVNIVATDPTWVRDLAAQNARKIEAPLLMSNRIGASWVHEGGAGGAAVFSANGEILAAANTIGKEDVVVTELSLP